MFVAPRLRHIPHNRFTTSWLKSVPQASFYQDAAGFQIHKRKAEILFDVRKGDAPRESAV
jgi:hypothetical protein